MVENDRKSLESPRKTVKIAFQSKSKISLKKGLESDGGTEDMQTKRKAAGKKLMHTQSVRAGVHAIMLLSVIMALRGTT